MQKKISVILSAGGIGTRMKSSIPKQFLPLNNKPIALHSFDLFASMSEVAEIVVVCSPEYRHLFVLPKHSSTRLHFASPGDRRQDSVYNGFQALTLQNSIVCVHDAARPFITPAIVQHVLAAALEHGAATAAMPVKFTIKEADSNAIVKRTIDRSTLWEIQTPQMIEYSLLQKGFEKMINQNLSVTDDVSLVELLGLPVKLVEGCYRNIKITTPEDMAIAHQFIKL